MADILSTSLSLEQQPDGAFRAITVVEVRFSAREVTEDLDYSVSVAVMRTKPGVQIVPILNGRNTVVWMELPQQLQSLGIGAASTSLKPGASTTATVRKDFVLSSSLASGESVQLVAVVAPEVTGAINHGRAVAVP